MQNRVRNTGPSEGCTTSVNSSEKLCAASRHEQAYLPLSALFLLLASLLL